jgi:carbon storage regulator CsrA
LQDRREIVSIIDSTNVKEDIMLVLSRKEGESVVIDGEIVVTILEIRGSQIRLGIEAPREVPVLRGELEVVQPVLAVA